MHLGDCTENGFDWVVGDDEENTVFAYVRRAEGHRPVVVAVNFTPVPRDGYRIGVPVAGRWEALLDTDAEAFGGSGVVNEAVATSTVAAHGQRQSIAVRLGPLAVSVLRPAR